MGFGKKIWWVVLFIAFLTGAAAVLPKIFGLPNFFQNDNPSNNSPSANMPKGEKPFLHGINFDDGGEYLLLLRYRGVETIIDQRLVLKKYQNKIFVGGLNWMAFLPGERGHPERSITVFKDGKSILHADSHKSKKFRFADISKHGVTVEHNYYYENRQDIQARLKMLELPNAEQVYLVDRPEAFEKYDYELETILPVFWVSTSIPKPEIDARINAEVIRGLKQDIRAKKINVPIRKLSNVFVLDVDGRGLENKDGTPLIMDEYADFYRPRIHISCETEADCKALKEYVRTIAKTIISWRDNDLLNGIENPLFPARDENGNRELQLGISLSDRSMIQITENNYSLSYYSILK